jgi:hypothetical protein
MQVVKLVNRQSSEKGVRKGLGVGVSCVWGQASGGRGGVAVGGGQEDGGRIEHLAVSAHYKQVGNTLATH